MTTSTSSTTDRPAVTGHRRAPGPVRRTASLARAELLLLARNRTMVFSALGVPAGLVALLVATGGDRLAGPTGAAGFAALTSSTLLLLVVFYTVLSAAVARREDGVLQRLRTGTAGDAEVLVALAVPAVAVVVVVQVLVLGAGALAADVALPTDPLPFALGLLLASAALAGLALWTASWTRTLESAQVTSLPVLAVCLLGGGFVPLDALPDPVATAAGYTPLAPLVELVRASWTGGYDALDVARCAGVLLGWVVLTAVLVRRGFRWSARS